MKNQSTPMSVTQVLTTTNYSLFKELDGNRSKNQLHLKRLRRSMEEKVLFSPIIVNEKYEVIDGQHRLYCYSELKKPVPYIVCFGYGLPEVQILNANSKNWNADDFMNGYCDLGYDDYIKYREFKKKYDFGHNESISLLTGTMHGGNSVKDFYNGSFKIKSIRNASEIADKILEIKPYFKDYKARSFIYAMISVMKNKNFSFKEFIGKLKNRPTVLQKHATTEQYKRHIEDIYNYKKINKVSLRF